MALPQRLPRAELDGQVPPRAAGAVAPEDALEGLAVVARRPSPLARTRRERRLDELPQLVADRGHALDPGDRETRLRIRDALDGVAGLRALPDRDELLDG